MFFLCGAILRHSPWGQPTPHCCGMMLLYISPALCHSMKEREGGRKREGGREGGRKGERDSGRERIDGLTMNIVKK